MALNNPWITYIDRSYQQIKSAVLARLATETPEITDHSETNPLVKMVSIFAGMIEMVGFYVDNWSREGHISTCRLYSSGVIHAKDAGYRVHGYVPSYGLVRVTLSSVHASAITIPASTQFSDVDGNQWFSTEDTVITAGNLFADVPVRQQVQISGVTIATTTGAKNQSYRVTDSVADGTVVVSINGEAWLSKDTLSYSLPTDKHFVQSVDTDGFIVLQFGDGVTGAIPANGYNVIISYKRTTGLNYGPQTINQIVTALSLPGGRTATCINPDRTSGGQGVETLEQLKYRVPRSYRTLERAVSSKDYSDLAERYPGVQSAVPEYDCRAGSTLFIYPVGGGLATSGLCTDVENYFDDKLLLGQVVTVLPAGEVHVKIAVRINVKPNYYRAQASSDVRAQIEAFISSANQKIKGIVHLSDLYQIIENLPAIDNSTIEVMRAIPYARAIDSSPTLNWTAEIKDASSSTIKWRIVMVSSTSFQLYKAGSYISTHSTGVLVDLPEVKFTITGSYAIGNQWTFYTYNSYGTLILAEPSMPVCLGSDLVIYANGGIV